MIWECLFEANIKANRPPSCSQQILLHFALLKMVYFVKPKEITYLEMFRYQRCEKIKRADKTYVKPSDEPGGSDK